MFLTMTLAMYNPDSDQVQEIPVYYIVMDGVGSDQALVMTYKDWYGR